MKPVPTRSTAISRCASMPMLDPNFTAKSILVRLLRWYTPATKGTSYDTRRSRSSGDHDKSESMNTRSLDVPARKRATSLLRASAMRLLPISKSICGVRQPRCCNKATLRTSDAV